MLVIQCRFLDTAGDMTYSFPAMTKVASSTEHTAAEPTASSSK